MNQQPYAQRQNRRPYTESSSSPQRNGNYRVMCTNDENLLASQQHGGPQHQRPQSSSQGVPPQQRAQSNPRQPNSDYSQRSANYKVVCTNDETKLAQGNSANQRHPDDYPRRSEDYSHPPSPQRHSDSQAPPPQRNQQGQSDDCPPPGRNPGAQRGYVNERHSPTRRPNNYNAQDDREDNVRGPHPSQRRPYNPRNNEENYEDPCDHTDQAAKKSQKGNSAMSAPCVCPPKSGKSASNYKQDYYDPGQGDNQRQGGYRNSNSHNSAGHNNNPSTVYQRCQSEYQQNRNQQPSRGYSRNDDC